MLAWNVQTSAGALHGTRQAHPNPPVCQPTTGLPVTTPVQRHLALRTDPTLSTASTTHSQRPSSTPPAERGAERDQVHSLRSLPLHLSGINVRHLGQVTRRCSCAETTSSASTQNAWTATAGSAAASRAVSGRGAAPAANGYHSLPSQGTIRRRTQTQPRSCYLATSRPAASPTTP